MGPNTHPNDVLLVEDDNTFAEELSLYLSSHGIEVFHASSMEIAFERLAEKTPDVIVLDQFLGSTDTLSVIRRLRQEYSGGVMFLTGNAESTDRIVGLEMGADDFVSKLISPREILARLRSLLRRPRAFVANDDQAPGEAAPGRRAGHTGRWVLDTNRHELFGPDGKLVHLTSAEFGTLRHLNAHKGQPVSRDDLSRAVLHRRFDALDRSIDNLVSRLRKKFEALDPSCRVLKTVRGEGYVFVGFDDDTPNPNAA
jgi:DNA-binding response OmpR family regulator